jgi:uncharacterized tellurite resistance protein B-like protein
MEELNIERLLLRTAFSCMACDGDVDKTEVALIRKLHEDHQLFGAIDIDKELELLLIELNTDGQKFIRGYFNELASAKLKEEEELKLIEVAIDTIKADDIVEYSEVKFFKVIRSKLKIADEAILTIHPDFEEYLEQDVFSSSYLSKLQDDFLSAPEFGEIEKIDVNVLKGMRD